jgi:hypothetical protein
VTHEHSEEPFVDLRKGLFLDVLETPKSSVGEGARRRVGKQHYNGMQIELSQGSLSDRFEGWKKEMHPGFSDIELR